MTDDAPRPNDNSAEQPDADAPAKPDEQLPVKPAAPDAPIVAPPASKPAPVADGARAASDTEVRKAADKAIFEGEAGDPFEAIPATAGLTDDAVEAAAAANPGQYWLENPKNVRLLIFAGAFVLMVLIVLDFFVEHHPHFSPTDGIDIDTKPEFFVAFGFLACVLQVFIAKALARLVKRKTHFYENEKQQS